MVDEDHTLMDPTSCETLVVYNQIHKVLPQFQQIFTLHKPPIVQYHKISDLIN